MTIDELFSKKVLLIVPHQDDEIHLAGNVLASLKDTSNIKVLYTTNGDFIFNAKYRYKEAIKSLKTFNIRKDNVIFMGYSDQAYDAKDHMYELDEDWISKKGLKETYAPQGYNEWNFTKHNEHCLFNKQNFTRNIKEIIEDLTPEVILCVDLDFHPDHIMTSLCFEKAMGEILNKENNSYYPIVLKTFTYENSYFGKEDFNDLNDYEMFFDTDENGNLINNMHYNINEKISIPSNEKCYTKNLLKNKIWKAIKAHKSQILVSHANSMINSNSVYWLRNTDNLINKAEVSVTSSEKSYLNDFLLCDASKILNGNKQKIRYDKAIWIPEKEDNEKEIHISFKEKTYVECIKLYMGLINENYIKNIKLVLDNKASDYILSGQPVEEIGIKETVQSIIIKVLDKTCENGFSEIELLDGKTLKLDFKEEKNDTNKKTALKKIYIRINKIIIKCTIIKQKIYRKMFIRDRS